MRETLVGVLVTLCAAIAGCGGGDDDAAGDGDADADGDSDSDADADADADADDVPQFETAASSILLRVAGSAAAGEFGMSAMAIFYDDPPPVPQSEVAREGSCRLLRWEEAFCDPICFGICIRENECIAYPEALSAGTLTFDGLAEALVLEPDPQNGYAMNHATPGALFEPGEPVSVDAEGADVPAFHLEALGVEVLDHDFDALVPNADGELVIRWTPGDVAEARVRARLITDQHHGIEPVVVECDSADDGRLAVPASMVEELSDIANWSCGDCFTHAIERYTRAVTTAGGHEVELVVSHHSRVYAVPWDQ